MSATGFSKWRLLGGHALALVLGVGIALATRRAPGSDFKSSVDNSLYRVKSGWTDAAEGIKRRTGLSRGTAVECREAWGELMARPMSEREKRAAAIKLLEKWAEADLKGAFTAAIEADHRGWASEPLKGGLLQELGNVVNHHAEAFIPLIEQRAFGLDTSAVAAVWAGKIGRRDPLLALSHLELLPPQSREDAVKKALGTTVYHPERIDAIRQSMENLKDTPLNRKLKEMAAKQLDR